MSPITSESTFTTRDSQTLYTKTWTPSSPSPIHLVFIHGFSDHINAYYDLFPTLASPPYNITIHGFDQRGWGRSVQQKSHRGLTGDTTQVLSDIHDFVCHVSGTIRSGSTADNATKLFLMGHSMGGAESLLYLLSNPHTHHAPNTFAPDPFQFSGLLLESPHVGFPPTSAPSPLTVFAGRLAGRFLPTMQLVQKLPSHHMSRNPQICKDWEDDELCHDTGTLRGLAGLLDRAGCLEAFGRGRENGSGLLGKGARLGCPLFWGHGTGDLVCDFEAGERLYERLMNESGDKRSRFVKYEGAYHKIHGEPDGVAEAFARDCGEWILMVAGVVQADTQSESVEQSAEGAGLMIPAAADKMLGKDEAPPIASSAEVEDNNAHGAGLMITVGAGKETVASAPTESDAETVKSRL